MILAVLGFLAQTGPLADLRVGEDGEIARVVLVCTEACTAAPADGGPGTYRIEGLRDTVSVDTGGALVRGLTITPKGSASILRVDMTRPPRAVRLSRCAEASLCFDIDLSDAPPPPRPPSLGTITRGVDDLEARGAPQASLRAQLERAANQQLSPQVCAEAKTRLAANAWALGAFRTHALCTAARGAVGEADGYLARLEAYAPSDDLTVLRALLADRANATARR